MDRTPLRTLALAVNGALAVHVAVMGAAYRFADRLPTAIEPDAVAVVNLVSAPVLVPEPPPPTPPEAKLPSAQPPPAPADSPEPPPPPEPPTEQQVAIGIDNGSPEARAWLGFADPTPHAARRSVIDQAAMDPEPGTPGRAATPPSAPPTTPHVPASGVPTQTPDDVGPAPAPMPTPAAIAPRPPVPGVSEAAPQAPPAAEPVMHADVPTPPLAPGVIVPPAPASDRPVTPTVPTPSPALPQAEPAPNEPPGTLMVGQNPGNQSDSESVATAVDEPVRVAPGRPLAAKGLRIRTVRPRYSSATLLTAHPRDASIRVSFAKSGIVKEADFVAGQTTGYPEVDRSLRAAVYQWTAAGEALDKLSAEDPAARVTITFRVLMR